MAPSGRLIASQPIGWLPVGRLKLPPGGGPVKLSGGMAVAEALGCEDAYLVRATPAPIPSGLAAPVLSLTLLGRDGQAKLSGRQVPLRPRHAEILTLLCANPDGMTSEQLAEGVYGDSSRGGGIRVEISRLHKLLGDVIETEHYRLRAGVLSDVAQVCGLLHRGRVRDAATRYPGPLLPRSRAPGVIHEREASQTLHATCGSPAGCSRCCRRTSSTASRTGPRCRPGWNGGPRSASTLPGRCSRSGRSRARR